MDELTILVASCDKNADLFEPYHYCMEKYWPDHPPIVYSTETVINPYYETIPKNYDISHWTRRIRETLHEIDSKYVLLMVDDIFLRKPVNTAAVYALTSMFTKHTAAINLEKRFDSRDVRKNEFVSQRWEYGRYKVSVMCQIWDKDRLGIVLETDRDPWSLERNSTGCGYEYLISNTGNILDWGYYDQYGNKQWFGLRQGKWCREAKLFFDKEGFANDYDKRGFN